VSGKMGQSARDTAKAAAASESAAVLLVTVVVDEAAWVAPSPPLSGADAADDDEVPTGDVIADAAGPLALPALAGSPETVTDAAVFLLASGKLSSPRMRRDTSSYAAARMSE
jgi:hypothetical protein